MRKGVVCQEKGVPMTIHLDPTCFVIMADFDFRKEELRKAAGDSI
jgi:hypothetical protein